MRPRSRGSGIAARPPTRFATLPAVHRASILAALAMIGCGRLGFGDSSPDAGHDGPPPDAPPVPDSICQVDRIALAGLPARADLAITGTTEGYAVVWADTSGAMPVQGALLTPNHQLKMSVALPGIHDPRIGGITDVGMTLVLSTASATKQTTWTVGRDLATATAKLVLSGAVLGHGPYPSDTARSPRVFVTGSGTMLSAAYISDDGTIDNASAGIRSTAGEILDLTCDDGSDHAQCAWAEAIPPASGGAQCTASDVDLQPAPSIPGGAIVSSDCHDIRTSSGPDLADSMIVVWTTSAQSLEARYVGANNLDIPRPIAPAGSAPKVQFDGIQTPAGKFWIAWLDGQGALQLTSFDQMGATVSYSLAGWVPRGPEAFELVRRGGQTALVLLSPDGLEFLTICT